VTPFCFQKGFLVGGLLKKIDEGRIRYTALNLYLCTTITGYGCKE
jgi:hypothetical protein